MENSVNFKAVQTVFLLMVLMFEKNGQFFIVPKVFFSPTQVNFNLRVDTCSLGVSQNRDSFMTQQNMNVPRINLKSP